ncbi:MAG: efflux transporter outer membrane subunit [Burkholderiaceae bacterium]
MTDRSFRRRGASLAVALAIATMAAGCSFIPAHERPAAPIPAAYPASSQGAPGTTKADAPAPADVAWQDFFGDERLRRLIQIALDNNRDLRVAVLNVEQARAAFQIRQADLLPTVNAGAQATRSYTPSTLSVTGSPLLYNTLGVSVGITSYELDLFGRVRALKDQALAQFFATEENRKAAQISLVASVANAYLAMVADDELLRLTERTLATRDESFRLSKLRFDNGVASEVDLRQAETLVEAARASMVALRRQRQLDENTLALLLGQALPADLPPSQALGEQTMLAEVPPGLPSDLLVRRPDIRAQEQQLVAAEANIGAARAAFFPRIALTGSLGFGSRELNQLFEGSSRQWSIGPALSVPIFDGGRNRATLESARVQRDIMVAQYEKTIQSAFKEVSDALAGSATLGDQLGALRAQAEAESQRLKLADLRYKGGASSYLDLLDAQRSLYTVQQSVIQTQLAQLQARVTLYRALGGGWQEPMVASVESAVPARTRISQ